MENKKFNSTAAAYLMNDAPVITLVMDEKGKILQCSKYTTELTGKHLEGELFFDIIVDFHRSLNIESLFNNDSGKEHLINIANRSGIPQTFYFKFFRKDEHVYAFGRTDVSESEMLHNELLSLNSELNTLTRDLQKKNNMLQELDKLKNQFLGMAAHDLRKPLSVIMLAADFVLSGVKPPSEEMYRKFLGKIFTASESMKQLIDDFLDFAVIESGKLQLKTQPVDIASIFRNSREITMPAAQKKNITLDFRQNDNIPEFLADGPKLEQVVMNLVENAILYSPADSSVEVTASWKVEGKEVEVSVSDHGAGIENAQLKTLFQPFEKGRSGGTGLGLAIARKILEAHSGKIWCSSELGVGTTFTFSLPVQIPADG